MPSDIKDLIFEDAEILQIMRPFIDYVDGGYVCDTMPEKVIEAGKELLKQAGVPEIEIRNCSFEGKNEDGSDALQFEKVDGLFLTRLKAIKMIGWKCTGFKDS